VIDRGGDETQGWVGAPHHQKKNHYRLMTGADVLELEAVGEGRASRRNRCSVARKNLIFSFSDR
jgi:hypothetical protein